MVGKKKKWIFGILLAVFLGLWGLPRLLIYIGDEMERPSHREYSYNLNLDLSPIQRWYELASYSPLTKGTVARRLAKLHMKLASDGLHSRTRFNRYWRYMEKALEFGHNEDLVSDALFCAKRNGQYGKVVELAERLSVINPNVTERLKTAYLMKGWYEKALPIYKLKCFEENLDCEKACLLAFINNDMIIAERLALKALAFLDRRKPNNKNDVLYSYYEGKIKSNKLRLAYIITKNKKPEEAKKMYSDILETKDDWFYPLAKIGLAEIEEKLGNKARVLELLEFDTSEMERGCCTQYCTQYYEGNWCKLIDRWSLALFEYDRIDEALNLLTHCYTLNDGRRSTRNPINEYDVLRVRPSDLPVAYLERIVEKLKEVSEQPGAHEAISGLLSQFIPRLCRAYLMRADWPLLEKRIEEARKYVRFHTVFPIAYYAAIAQGQWKTAYELCSEMELRDPDFTKYLVPGKKVIAQLFLGKHHEIREKDIRNMGWRFLFFTDNNVKYNLLDCLRNIDETEKLSVLFKKLESVRKEHKDCYNAGTERGTCALIRALDSIEQGDMEAAVVALGSEYLDFAKRREDVLIFHLLILKIDPTGKELVFRIQAGLSEGMIFHSGPHLLFALSEISGLQRGKDREDTLAILEKHQHAVKTILDFKWYH